MFEETPELLARLESLDGNQPFQILDRSPDTAVFVGQIISSARYERRRSALWTTESGKVLWSPEGVSGMAWFPDNISLGVVYSQYSYQPDLHTIIGSPLQREFSYAFVQVSWPELTLIGSCELSPLLGMPIDLTISPRGDHATILWCDQTASGLSFVQTENAELIELSQFWYDIASDIVTRPVWSRDGKHLAFGWQEAEVWWATNPTEPDEEEPAAGGHYVIGHLTILDLEHQIAQTYPLADDIPPGWLPIPDLKGTSGFLRDPVFLDNARVVITLPTGKKLAFAV
jgi:hypothetical protein